MPDELLLLDMHLHKFHNLYKCLDLFYKYLPPKLHLPDIRQYMFRKQYNLL